MSGPAKIEGTITVAELMELLSKCDPSLLVVMQEDPEGNAYRPLGGVDPACGYLGKRWSGEVKTWPSERTKDMDPEDVADESYVPCLVLYP